MDKPAPPPEGTRLNLIEAGLHLFGHQGFAAASTRAIAARAGTNIGSIAYYFGGKDGLRAACAAEFARRMQAVLTAIAPPPAPAPTPDAAVAQMKLILRTVASYLLAGREAGDMVPFMLRELSEGGPTLAIIYDQLVAPVHGQLCALWARATGEDADSPAVRLRLFSVIGQVVYFRIGMPVVTRRMGWQAVGPDEAGRIIDVLLSNLDAAIDAARKGM